MAHTRTLLFGGRRGLQAAFFAALVASLAGGQSFTDPAPTTVHAIKDVPAPAPQAHPGLTFHAAPKPLAADAVVADVPSFIPTAGIFRSPDKPLLKELPKSLPVVWEVSKGLGYAAPAIVGDRLILFHRLKDEEIVECLHRETGQRFWRYAYATAYQDRYGWSDGPRCGVVIDPKTSLVFTCGAEGKLTAIDLVSGQLVWSRNLLPEFKLQQNFFGVGSTPLLEGDLLIVNVGAKGACAVGFETRTGKARWAAPAPRDWGPSYAAPVAATVHGLRRVFVFAGGESRPVTGGLICVNPVDGSVDFSFPWRGRRYESVNASAPLIIDPFVYISECYGKGGVLLEMTLEGQKLSAKQSWATDRLGTHFMTALHLDGYLYGVDGHGPSDAPIVCLDFKTGQEKWRAEPDLSEAITTFAGTERQQRLSTCLSHFLRVDNRVLCLTEWGHLLYLDLSPGECKVTSRTLLFYAGQTWTPPVISRGLLYVCQNDPDKISGKPNRLICYDLRGTK